MLFYGLSYFEVHSHRCYVLLQLVICEKMPCLVGGLDAMFLV